MSDEQKRLVHQVAVLLEANDDSALGRLLGEQRSSEIGDYSSIINAEVASAERTAVAAGTLVGNNMPRLVQKGDFRLESYLEGILMLFAHRDVPGVIGSVGNVFGRYRINISHMSVGRGSSKPGGDAVGVMGLDAQPPAEALAEILALAPMMRASVVQLPPAGKMPAWLGG